MKRVLLFFYFIILIPYTSFAQDSLPPKTPLDTIFKLNGTAMPCEVTTVTPAYVSFVLPGKSDEYTIERKEVQRIIYRTGRIDVLNKAVFQLIDESNWEAVWVTEDKKQIGNLYMLGEVEGRSPSSARSASAAKKGAIIKLKKKAANMKGTLVLVTKKETTGGYGEYPGYVVKGIAYGPEPPAPVSGEEKGKNEVKDAGM